MHTITLIHHAAELVSGDRAFEGGEMDQVPLPGTLSEQWGPASGRAYHLCELYLFHYLTALS